MDIIFVRQNQKENKRHFQMVKIIFLAIIILQTNILKTNTNNE